MRRSRSSVQGFLRELESANTDAPRPGWLFVDDSAAFGGHEVMLLRRLHELQAQGRVRPHVLARAGGRLHAQLPEAWRGSASFAPTEGGARWKAALAGAAVLHRVLRAERPSACIFASGCISEQTGLVAQARLAGVRSWVYVLLVDRFEAMQFRSGRWQDRLVRWGYGASRAAGSPSRPHRPRTSAHGPPRVGRCSLCPTPWSRRSKPHG